jgi:hypothetical protein
MELFGEWRNTNSRKAQADPTSTTLSVAATPREDMMEWEATTTINANSTRAGRIELDTPQNDQKTKLCLENVPNGWTRMR